MCACVHVCVCVHSCLRIMLITQYVFCTCKSCGFVSTLLGRFRSMFLDIFGHHYHQGRRLCHRGLGFMSAFLVMNVLSALAFPARFFCLAFVFCNRQKVIIYLSCVVTSHTVVYRSEILWPRTAFKKNQCLHVYFLLCSDSQTANMQAFISKFIY